MRFRRTRHPTPRSGARRSREGDKVVFWHISANRDDTVFGDPDAFDISRDPNPHMAFGGGGPHFCLGANLARMEIAVMFDRLLDRLPDLSLDGPASGSAPTSSTAPSTCRWPSPHRPRWGPERGAADAVPPGGQLLGLRPDRAAVHGL